MAEEVSHEQIGAMLMAIYLKGMTTAETVQLTKSLLYSGETLSWPGIEGAVGATCPILLSQEMEKAERKRETREGEERRERAQNDITHWGQLKSKD